MGWKLDIKASVRDDEIALGDLIIDNRDDAVAIVCKALRECRDIGRVTPEIQDKLKYLVYDNEEGNEAKDKYAYDIEVLKELTTCAAVNFLITDTYRGAVETRTASWFKYAVGQSTWMERWQEIRKESAHIFNRLVRKNIADKLPDDIYHYCSTEFSDWTSSDETEMQTAMQKAAIAEAAKRCAETGNFTQLTSYIEDECKSSGTDIPESFLNTFKAVSSLAVDPVKAISETTVENENGETIMIETPHFHDYTFGYATIKQAVFGLQGFVLPEQFSSLPEDVINDIISSINDTIDRYKLYSILDNQTDNVGDVQGIAIAVSDDNRVITSVVADAYKLTTECAENVTYTAKPSYLLNGYEEHAFMTAVNTFVISTKKYSDALRKLIIDKMGQSLVAALEIHGVERSTSDYENLSTFFNTFDFNVESVDKFYQMVNALEYESNYKLVANWFASECIEVTSDDLKDYVYNFLT